jgi:hypothetical protein
VPTVTTEVNAPTAMNDTGQRTARPKVPAGTRAGPSARTTAVSPTSTLPGRADSASAHTTRPPQSSSLSAAQRRRQALAQAASSTARPVMRGRP